MKGATGKGDALDDLRAAQVAFAQAESAMHAELQQLHAKHQALLAEHQVALGDRSRDREELQSLRDQAVQGAAQLAGLQTELRRHADDHLALKQALGEQRAKAQGIQEHLHVRLAEGIRELERARADHTAAKADIERQRQSLRQFEALREGSMAESAETLRRVRARADELERQLGELRLERDREVGALSHSLIEREHAHIKELAAVREHAQQQHQELIDHMTRDGSLVQGLARVVEQRDQLIGSLGQRLVDSAALTERVSHELDRLRAQQLKHAQDGESQRYALEAALAAHQQRLVALQAALDMAARRHETELREARAGHEGLEHEVRASQSRFSMLAASHATALQVLDEARETQRLNWMQQQHDQRLELAASLQAELGALRHDRDALARELTDLQQALAQAMLALRQAQVSIPAPAEPPPAADAPAAPPAATLTQPALPARGDTEPFEPSRTSMSQPTTAEALLQLHDAAFVDAAYRALLDRPPEPEGLNSHLGQLRQGVSKELLLVAMAGSAEARQAARPLAGIDRLRTRVNNGQERLLQRVMRRLRGRAEVGVAGPLAIVENRLGAQALQGQGLMQQALGALDRLGLQVAQLDQRVRGIDEQLALVQGHLATSLSQGEALAPRLQVIEGNLQALLQRADATEARLARLDTERVGLLLALGGRGAATDAKAASTEPGFDAAAIVRVRDMLKAASESAA